MDSINVSDSLKIRKTENPIEDQQTGYVSYRKNDFERTPNADTVNFRGEEDNNKKNNAGKVIALTTAVLAIGSAIYAGFHGKNILKQAEKETGIIDSVKTGYKNFFSSKDKAVEKLKTITEEVQEVSQKLEEYTIDAFKKDHKFVNGKAQLKNGEMFTGKITGKNAKGDFVMEYENGLLKSSTIKNGDEIVLQKNYQYNENGFKIYDEKGNWIYQHDLDKEKNILCIGNPFKPSVIKDLGKNKILRMNGADYYYRPDGTLKYTKSCLSGCYDMTLFHADGKTPKIKTELGTSTFYDEQGSELFKCTRIVKGDTVNIRHTRPNGEYFDYFAQPKLGETLHIGNGANRISYHKASYIDDCGKEIDCSCASWNKGALNYDYPTGKYTLKEGQEMTAELQALIDRDAAKELPEIFEKERSFALNASNQIETCEREIQFPKSHYLD